MPLGEHLEDLRRRLISALVGIGVALGVTIYFGFDIILFLAQPLLQSQRAMGYPLGTYDFDATAGFTGVFIPVTLVAAVILASPWVIYQLWLFIVAGLYSYERHAMRILAPFSTVMVLLGVLFTYYILLPVCLLFFLNFATLYPKVHVGEPNFIMKQFLRAYDAGPAHQPLTTDDTARPLKIPVLRKDPLKPTEGDVWINGPEHSFKAFVANDVRVLSAGPDRLITPLPKAGEYVRFAAFMMLGVVIAFQVPVAMLILGWTGLFEPKRIAKVRKYAIFACAAAGAVLTPTDVFSMVVLAVPLYLLFEFGLLLMRWTEGKPD